MIRKITTFIGDLEVLFTIEKEMDKILNKWENNHTETYHDFLYVFEKEGINLKVMIYEKLSNSEDSETDCMGRENDRERNI